VAQPKFKKGDLVYLNDFGVLVTEEDKLTIALIVEGPYDLHYPTDNKWGEVYYNFWSYDIMIGKKLITLVPEEFLERMIKNEKDPE
jgi:hypothetical protein